MTCRLFIGDVFKRMAELEGPYDLVITSPPFSNLRSYLPDDHPDKHLEIGSEATPAEYLDVMLALTAEWGRLLAPHGSIAIEIGDTYSGSGGAGGDYNPDGLREGQNKAKGSAIRSRSAGSSWTTLADGGGVPGGLSPAKPGTKSRVAAGTGWPLDKSLAMIPELYAASLAYGRNLLTGQTSPAGRWRVRNFKPWIRSNPPVGALGDKERPATSYITVATRNTDRYFDLDAVRTAHVNHQRDEIYQRHDSKREKARVAAGLSSGNGFTAQNPAGAPPLDWVVDADLIIDDEIDQRVGKRSTGGSPANTKRSHSLNNAGWSEADNDAQPYDGGVVGARGVHIRRRLQAAGILPTPDAYDISPRGYKGAHYAVWPPELVKRLLLEMCPRRVCTECGKPSRRLLTKQSPWGRQPELAAHIKERRKATGYTLKEVDDWFGFNGMAAHWEDGANQPAVPRVEDWIVLKERLALSDEFDSFIAERTESGTEYVPRHFNGPKQASRDKKQTYYPNIKADPIRKDFGWSDCGHNTWRPGRVLDPFAGSGTTLAVATGLGFHADGIDLDETNADLARERCGMFLEVIDQPTSKGAA